LSHVDELQKHHWRHTDGLTHPLKYWAHWKLRRSIGEHWKRRMQNSAFQPHGELFSQAVMSNTAKMGQTWLKKDLLYTHFGKKTEYLYATCIIYCGSIHRCKKVFLRFFIMVTFFLHFWTFFIFQTFFINKKHFQNNSNETDLWFFCCISNDLKCLPINFYLLTMFDALCVE